MIGLGNTMYDIQVAGCSIRCVRSDESIWEAGGSLFLQEFPRLPGELKCAGCGGCPPRGCRDVFLYADKDIQ